MSKNFENGSMNFPVVDEITDVSSSATSFVNLYDTSKGYIVWNKQYLPRSSRSGLVECLVIRNGNNFEMYLDSFGKKNELLLVATKRQKNPSEFHISLPTNSTSNEKNMEIIAKLTRSCKVKNFVDYELIKDECNAISNRIALICYEIPSVLEMLKECPPRRARFTVGNMLDMSEIKKLQQPQRLMMTNAPRNDKDTVLKKGMTNNQTDGSTTNVLGVTFETKEPQYKEGQQLRLNFFGRGREGSTKNMQLENMEGDVILQVIKWDKDQFHLDFVDPIQPHHAFAFSLAQMDL